jgi:hypothetical protein
VQAKEMGGGAWGTGDVARETKRKTGSSNVVTSKAKK